MFVALFRSLGGGTGDKHYISREKMVFFCGVAAFHNGGMIANKDKSNPG
jgi:hypothetical protein